jgi:hypothetical protein
VGDRAAARKYSAALLSLGGRADRPGRPELREAEREVNRPG